MNLERILMRSPSVSAELQRADYQRQKEKLPQRVQTALSVADQKRCFKCQTVKPLNEFYRHPQMRDGHLGKCKECNKADVKSHRRTPRGALAIHEYEKWRFTTSGRKLQYKKYQKEYRQKFPEKYAAHIAVGNAVRDGRLKRLPCEVCGNPESEGHHDDYSKPLDVRWLCFKHHREVHGQIVICAQ